MYKIIGRNLLGCTYELDGVFTLDAATDIIEKAFRRAQARGYFCWLEVSLILDV